MMAVFDWIWNVWRYLTRLADLGKYCFQDVNRFDECEPFWEAIGIALAIVCVLTLMFIARHFFRAYSVHRRAWARRQAELAVAPAEVMEQVKWTGDNALDPNLSQEEVIQRIKQAKSRLRTGEASATGDKAGGDKALGIDLLHR
jgi:hypothetical protein